MNTIETRKELFTRYIINKDSKLNDEIIELFYITCSTDEFSNHKYFFPFFRATFKYYENNIKNNLNIFDKWLNYINYRDLNFTSTQNYSDLDIYIIISLKINMYLLNIEFINDLIKYYQSLSIKTSFESDFYIKYNLCKFLYTTKSYVEARILYFEIIKYKREWYIEMIPFKFRDLEIKNDILINILSAKKINFYDFNIILKFLKESKILTNELEYIDKDPSYYEIETLKNITKNYIIKNSNSVQEGKLIKKFKTNVGFISNGKESYYVNSKYMKKTYKKNNYFHFITYDGYDFKKQLQCLNAIILREIKK